MHFLKVLAWAYFWSHKFFHKKEKNSFSFILILITHDLGQKTTPYAFFGRLNKKIPEKTDKCDHSFFF